jgi:uncharacterized protein YjbJ (UPF0337 family)
MNKDQFEGKWKQFVGAAKSRWGKLTDDDWKSVEGDAEKLAGKIQERYGDSKEETKEEIDRLLKNLDRKRPKTKVRK